MVPDPPAVVCFKKSVVDQCSHSAAGATYSLFGASVSRSHSFAVSSFVSGEDSVDAIRLSDIARERVCTSFSQHFGNAHAPCDAVENLRCDQLFSLRTFPGQKQMRLLWYIERIDVLEIVFLDFVNCSRKSHENLMNFKIALFFNSVLYILRDLLVLRVLVFGNTLRVRLNRPPNELTNYFWRTTIEALNCQINSPTEDN